MPELDITHPVHPRNPAHPDHHPFRAHHPHVENVRAIFGLFLATVLVLLVTIGLLTDAPFARVVLFFTPSILFALAGLSLVSADTFDIRHLALGLVALLVVAGVLFAFLAPDVSVEAMAATNLVLGAVLLLVLSQAHPREPRTRVVVREPQERGLSEILASLAAKTKALNVAIGRVYNASHGATAAMRAKVKVPPSWHAEASAETDTEKMRAYVRKVAERLSVLERPERKVFTNEELTRLRRLERDAHGATPILRVLEANEGTHVVELHRAALEYVRQAEQKRP